MPMLETVLSKIGLPILINILSGVLRAMDAPAAKNAGKALQDLEDVMKSGGLPLENIEEANRHIETLAKLQSEEVRVGLEQVNQSLRAEIASQDQFIRRMRPTFGYVMAVSWAAQMLGIAYIIIFDTQRAGLILNAMSSLSAIWAVGLSVLGVYVYKRSEDKKHRPPPETIIWNNLKD